MVILREKKAPDFHQALIFLAYATKRKRADDHLLQDISSALF